MTRLLTLYPIYCTDSGIGHICMSLCQAMQAADFQVMLTVPSTEPSDRRDFIQDAVPYPLRALSCRRPLRGLRRWGTQFRYVHKFQEGDVAYIWPGTSTWVFEELKRRGCTVILERVNCHRLTASRILNDAYARLGWQPAHGITPEDTAVEQEKLKLADYVLCPSPPVRQSMLDAAVPAEKLLSTSYGWEPRRLKPQKPMLPPIDGLTVIFVGLACVRKGIHLLLNAWERSQVKGRLIILGHIEPDVATGCSKQLSRPDVIHIPHCSNVAGAYHSADAFVFPTLEEGSPLVSYEALACGLPVITSPMGAGEVIRSDTEGVVLDPYEEQAWIDTLQRLARDVEWRNLLAQNARLRAQEYTWTEVGRRRRILIQSRLQCEKLVNSPSMILPAHS